MEFLIEYRLLGLFIGVCTFLIIGLFHPVVVKAEYYWGTRCWCFWPRGRGYSPFRRYGRSRNCSSSASGWPRAGFPPIRKGRERNRKRRGCYGDACLWLSLFATGIVGCKRLSSPACEGIVLSGRMDSAARGFRSLAGGSGPCGNSRFGTVLRKSCAVGQAQSLLIVRFGRSMPKRNVSRKELLYLACRFGRPEKVVGFGCK